MKDESKLDQKLRIEHPEYWKEENKKRYIEYPVLTANANRGKKFTIDDLTREETLIVFMCNSGWKLREIGRHFGKSHKTISRWIKRICDKLGTDTVPQFCMGWITYGGSEKISMEEIRSKWQELQWIKKDGKFKSIQEYNLPGLLKYKYFEGGDED